MKTKILKLFLTLVIFSSIQRVAAQGTTAFTYQGQLRDGGTNANGAYTMVFKLYDAITNGNQIGKIITNNPNLGNGLFSVNLDFGNVFNGAGLWLDIAAQSGTNAPETLSPRVQMMPAPYALYALASGSSTTNGTITAGTFNATNVVLGGGGTSWDFSIDGSGALVIAYGDPLKTVWADPNGSLSVRSNIVAVNGDFIAQNGGLQLFGPLGKIKFPDGSILTNAPPSISPWTIDSGTVSVPGGGTVSDGLRFSTFGVMRMGIDKDGNGVLVNGDLRANYIRVENDVDVMGTLYANADLHGNNADLDNIHARGNIDSDFYMHAQDFVQTSDRNMKDNFSLIDAQNILERVVSLPISSWNFKADAKTRHIGPMAQDFYAAFNVGPDDKHITTVDEGGVALAAIQGLNEKLREKDAQIGALEKRLADLEQLVRTFVQK